MFGAAVVVVSVFALVLTHVHVFVVLHAATVPEEDYRTGGDVSDGGGAPSKRPAPVPAQRQATEQRIARLKSDIARMATGLRKLVAGRNCCFVPECEFQLRNRPDKQEDLILLYQGKNMHRNALHLLVSRYDAVMNDVDDGTDREQSSAAALESLVTYMCRLGALAPVCWWRFGDCVLLTSIVWRGAVCRS